MGKKGWFSAVKKALTPSDSKDKKNKKSHKSNSKKSCSVKQNSLGTKPSRTQPVSANPVRHYPPVDQPKLSKAENEQNKRAYSVAYATAMAAEAAVAAAHAAAEVVRMTSTARFLGKSKEEIAAIKIQTAYRGYMARRALRALRGLARLKLLVEGPSVKRQASTTLRCMQLLGRVQSQVRARRIRMAEENQALQRQLTHKRHKEPRASMGKTWDVSRKSKEQIEASLQHKKEAAERRERALAYAHSHQKVWRNCAKSTNPHDPYWGWSWLEHWMAARPWETDREHTSIKSITRCASAVSHQSPSTGVRLRSARTKVGADDDARSLYSVQSERYRRHSVTGSDKSFTSSPSYPTSTRSTKTRLRMTSLSPSPLGPGNKGVAVGSAKRQLLFTSSSSPKTG